MTNTETDELTMCLCLQDRFLEAQEMLVVKTALKEQNTIYNIGITGHLRHWNTKL